MAQTPLYLRIVSTLVIASAAMVPACQVSDARQDVRNSATPTPSIEAANANNAISLSKVKNAQDEIDPEHRKRLEIENEKFRKVPEEFRYVDFRNFRFRNASKEFEPYIKGIPLKDGEYEYRSEHGGGNTYILDDVFYIDLTGDSKKEAVVFLNEISCGGSCDGGGALVYFFAARGNNPIHLAAIDTGCGACGCDLKSFRISNKQIVIEQFGCAKDDEDEDKVTMGKFSIEDVTISTYSLSSGKLRKLTSKKIDTPVTDVMNYAAEISINE